MEERKNTLLIVDDENANFKVLTHILGSEYTIYTATNGPSAVEKAREFLPDLILLDILMPDMDGYATLAKMKSFEDIRKIPVIFITGLDSDEDEEKGLALDAADYITKPFSAAIVRLRVRNQIKIVNQMRIIEHLSLIDQLTNIPNRRSFDDRMIMEWKQAVREKTPISILIIDLDNFKHVNDAYGHQQGDIVLQKTAALLPQSFKRPCDFAARWGGEEFVVLLPNTPLDGAKELAEKIRADIEKMAVKAANGSEIKITASVGVNSLIPGIESSVNAFFANMDKALYMAKEAGKNRVSNF